MVISKMFMIIHRKGLNTVAFLIQYYPPVLWQGTLNMKTKLKLPLNCSATSRAVPFTAQDRIGF